MYILTTNAFFYPLSSDICYSFFFFQAEDGIRDLTVTGVQTCALPILLGNGDGTFLPAVSYGSPNPTSLAVGDFNADGNPDLAVANWQNGTVSVLLGNGDRKSVV